MQKIVLILSIIAYGACNGPNKKTLPMEAPTPTPDTKAWDTVSTQVNTIVPYEDEDTVILLGRATRAGFEQPPFNDWFDENYNGSSVDPSKIAALRPLFNNVKIKIFMGTWCEDSRREIPRLYKILDTIGFDRNNFETIAISPDKTTPEGYEKGVDIEYVPTIIFYKNEKEIGRYVEYARKTLEDDMVSILSGKPYKHSYED
ncbi:MAG: thioredoxin [Marinirhabdus sp.]